MVAENVAFWQSSIFSVWSSKSGVRFLPSWFHIFRRTSVRDPFLERPGNFSGPKANLGALAAGREKEGELATTSLEFEFHLQFPCGSLSTELSDFPLSARCENERECKQTFKTRTNGNDVVTYVISANQYLASTFSMQIFKFQRCSCKLSFLFRTAVRARWRACSQVI